MRDSSAPRFQLERVVAEDGRVRVSGWWHGVRGRRFIRPTLTAVGARSRTRALAELEHKPWAATEDGQPWLAEFVWEQPLHNVEALELAVAPDLAVRIPPPGAPASAASEAAPSRGSAEPIAERPKGRRGAGMASPRRVVTSHAPAQPRVDVSGAEALRITQIEQERDRALAARDEAIAERERLVELRDQVVAERERLLEERGEALTRAAKVVAERDHAVSETQRVRDERDRAVRERDEARLQRERAERARDALANERRALQSERERLIQAGDQARAERNGLLTQHAKQAPERERLTRERDRAVARCDELAAERDQHGHARDEAVRERDRSAHALERLRRERDEAMADVRRLSQRAERLARERDEALAEVVSLTESELAASREATQTGAGVKPARTQLELAVSQPASPRDAVGHPELPPTQPRPMGAGPVNPTHRLLARAAALTGVVVVIVIVIVIVLSR